MAGTTPTSVLTNDQQCPTKTRVCSGTEGRSARDIDTTTPADRQSAIIVCRFCGSTVAKPAVDYFPAGSFVFADKRAQCAPRVGNDIYLVAIVVATFGSFYLAVWIIDHLS